jgi:hypothetical protein
MQSSPAQPSAGFCSSLLASLLGRRPEPVAAEPACVLATVPLSMEDVLLRGCKLKNSDFILGLALYTGPDSRIMKNARRAPFKARLQICDKLMRAGFAARCWQRHPSVSACAAH